MINRNSNHAEGSKNKIVYKRENTLLVFFENNWAVLKCAKLVVIVVTHESSIA